MRRFEARASALHEGNSEDAPLNTRETGTHQWPRVLLAAMGRILLLFAALVVIGYLWLAVAMGGGSPKWIERITLMAAVAFSVYWLLGWWPAIYTVQRRLLIAVTVLLMLPALILLFAVEPWQRTQMQRQNALLSNQTQLDRALERYACPEDDLLVVTPWIFIVDGEESRRLVELRLIPAERTNPSIVLARTTARGDFVSDQRLTTKWDAAASCVGGNDALQALVRRMTEGAYE